MTAIDSIHSPDWEFPPPRVRHQARRCLLDTLGVGVGGSATPLSRIIRNHSADCYGTATGGDRTPRLFLDGRPVSAPGAALAAGMTIDALDGHDGYNPAKGHVGAALVAGLLAVSQSRRVTGLQFQTALVLGYEFGCRLAVGQHATTRDYHTSGSWAAVAVAAAGARIAGLSPEATRHAMGIAEYHGPRSQMMRCIDHPTMLKDGAGWGAMAGVSAIALAERGFTGAPAVTAESEEVAGYWADLGRRWLVLDQYFKPYPVCRWAHAPVEGVLELAREHGVRPEDVERIEIETFHEAVRLAVNRPRNTEEAQYSTSFPCALALRHGDVRAERLSGDSLEDPETLRLAASTEMRESDEANARFPAERLARVSLALRDGRKLDGDWKTPRWDCNAPPSDESLSEKFLANCSVALSPDRAKGILDLVLDLESLDSEGIDRLSGMISDPPDGTATQGPGR